MEFKQYLIIFKKYWLFILAFALSGAVFAYLFIAKLPSGYQQEQLFFISSSQEEFNGYNFEGYYSQEKARNFTDTAVAILESSEFLSESSIPNAAVSTRKITPQLLRITTTTEKADDAASLISKISSDFNQKMKNLTSSDKTIQIKAVGPGSEVSYVAPSKKIFVPAGLAAGAIFALFIVGLKSYFRL